LDSSWNKVNLIISEQGWILLLTYAMNVSPGTLSICTVHPFEGQVI
jgi:hypothetical protein